MTHSVKDLKRRMSDAHEAYVAKLLRTVRSPGSGNSFSKQMDGRQDTNLATYAFAFDCKATMAASQSISIDMWQKAVDQAHDEWPCIPLRFYRDDRLAKTVDLVVLSFDDFVELLEAANAK